MIKMVVSDIDGTIYNHGISENIIKWADKIRNDGIKFVIATGRTFYSASNLLKPLNIDTPIICYQGATITNPFTKERIMEVNIRRELALKIRDYLKEFNIYPNIYIDDKLYSEKETQFIKDYSDYQDIPYGIIDDIATKDFDSVHKLLAISHDTELTAFLSKSLKEKFPNELYTTLSTPYFCEICNKDVSKANAMKFLAEQWGIKTDEIMACGDQNNDIEMIKTAGVGVAMGNGSDALKQCADYITSGVDEDGVVKAIRKFIYEEDV